MVNSAPFTGIGVALVTLFDDRHAVDEQATADLAARLVDHSLSRAVLRRAQSGGRVACPRADSGR